MTDAPTSAQLKDSILDSANRLRELRTQDSDKRSDTWERDVRHGIAEVTALDAELKAAYLSESKEEQPEVRGPKAAFNQVREYKSPGQEFIDSAPYKDRRDAKTSESEVRGGLRTLLDSSLTDPAAGQFIPVGSPLPPGVRQRRLFVRDLISVVPTSLNSVPYIRELNAVANELGATTVAESGAKPEVVMQFERDDAPIRKIAAWIPVTSEIVDDAPTLMGYINARLGYMLAIREEQQVLNGSGVSPQIKGIRNFSGVQTQAAVYSAGVATGNPADVPATVGKAIGLVENVDGEADAVVMTPADFWEGLTLRYSATSGQFDSVASGAGSPVVSQNPRNLWGYPVVTTRAATTDEALVGAFRLGATLFDRQQSVIKSTDSHSDYFTLNKLAILAEERVGLAVNRADYFVKAGLANHA